MHLATRRTRHFPINANIPINNSCYALLDDDDGTLWVGSLNGLLSFDPASGRFSRHRCTDYEPRLASLSINSLFRDSRQRVWIGTASGLYLWLPDRREVSTPDLQASAGAKSPPDGKSLA